jgi:hypothetical protein
MIEKKYTVLLLITCAATSFGFMNKEQNLKLKHQKKDKKDLCAQTVPAAIVSKWKPL